MSVAFLSAAVAAFPATPACVSHPQSLIEDVNVIDVLNGTVTPHQDVLIADGKIAAISREHQITKPGIPTRVYAGGKYLIPGLWDARVQLHYLQDERELYIAHGVTGVRDLKSAEPKVPPLEPDPEQRNTLTPQIVTEAPDDAGEANLSADNAAASIGESEIPMLTSVRRRLRLDWREMVNNPALQFVSADLRNAWASVFVKPELTAESLTARRQVYSKAEQTVRNRGVAGLPVLAGTDTGEPYTVPGDELHRELELLVDAGLSAAAAIRAATIEPARKFHLDKTLGTVEAGKDADLLLLDGNPLSDIRNTRGINAVFVKGRYLDRRQLDRIFTAAIHVARN